MKQVLHDFIAFFKSEYICHIFNSIIPTNSIHSIINKLSCSELVKSEKIAHSVYFLVYNLANLKFTGENSG